MYTIHRYIAPKDLDLRIKWYWEMVLQSGIALIFDSYRTVTWNLIPTGRHLLALSSRLARARECTLSCAGARLPVVLEGPRLCTPLLDHRRLLEQHPRFVGSYRATPIVVQRELVVLPAVKPLDAVVELANPRCAADGGYAPPEGVIS